MKMFAAVSRYSIRDIASQRELENNVCKMRATDLRGIQDKFPVK